jgi:hypothetical protein
MHVLSGIIMQRKGLTVGQAFAASIAFEVVENTVGVKMGFTTPEGGNNMTLDTVANMAGYFIGKKL